MRDALWLHLLAASQRRGGHGARAGRGDSDDGGNRRWRTLAVLLLGIFMGVMTTTIVNVAVPAFTTGLHANQTEAEWVVGAYALAYGVFLIPGGRLGDLWGHRVVFLLGVAGFTITAVLSALATDPVTLIVWRSAQGLFAGVMMPQVIASIPINFPPRQRGVALGLYGTVTALAAAVGPIVGGALVSGDPFDLSWRGVFLVNVPLGVIAMVATWWLVPESRGARGSIDPIGIVLLTASLLLLLVPPGRRRAHAGRDLLHAPHVHPARPQRGTSHRTRPEHRDGRS